MSSETKEETVTSPALEKSGGGGHERLSQRGSPATSPPIGSNGRPTFTRSPASNPNFSNLPPLVTQPVGRRTSSTRIPSYASRRVSTFSNNSGPPSRSRPGSLVFPVFHSSLPYALVRDFAYDTTHMLHYGPPPEPLSAASTNVSDFPRRLSDPLVMPNQGMRTPWSGHPGNADSSFFAAGPKLPSTSFADGPPWREDEDLLSPIVSTRHRKVKSNVDYFSSRQDATGMSGKNSSYASRNHDAPHNHYLDNLDEDVSGEPGGEVIEYPNSATSRAQGYTNNMLGPPHSHANGTYLNPETGYDDDEDNRFSRDYSFSIASPDEEMHGKAIALFDFESENNNELPLKEGQVLWVSYRHGEGWLVAKDPTTGEDGLVPESYVRLERDIPGGFGSLNGQIMGDAVSPIGPDTPIAITGGFEHHENSDSQGPSQYPMVSHFTTSSKDLLPHDKHTHTPISSSISPSRQLDAQLEAVAHGDKKDNVSSPEDESSSDTPETDEDDTQPVRHHSLPSVEAGKG